LYDASTNDLGKKRLSKKLFPKENRPFLCVYPRGTVEEKRKNMVVLTASDSIERMIEVISNMIPNHLKSITSEQLEPHILNSLFKRKLCLYPPLN
jgi:hypothetical protein